MSQQRYIEIQGARVNNLKNISVQIPENAFTVITGLSGSGKSSLAFDTLYAEGQRRYVESLSAYARQFLGRMNKPEVDFIKNIPPAIAIEQKVNTRNPRSTVGTSTEIYEYLRLLYARVGKTYSPVSGEEVKKHRTKDIIEYVLKFPEGSRFLVLCPLNLPGGRSLEEHLESFIKQGFSRIEYQGQIVNIEDFLSDESKYTLSEIESMHLVIDRLVVQADDKLIRSRLADSIETAFYEGNHSCLIRMFAGVGSELRHFSDRFEADGMVFEEPNDLMFSFNSPIGACPVCQGFGKVLGLDPDLIVPNKSLSVYDDAIVCWRGPKMSEWKDRLVENAAAFDFPVFKPWYQLSEAQKRLVWTGNGYFEGLDEFFRMVEANQYKVQYRVMLSRYRGKTLCPECRGTRLKKEASYVKVAGRSISELVDLSIIDLKLFFEQLQLSPNDKAIADRLLTEIHARIKFLTDVGLGYLSLNRLSSSLSGGESQRINLATSLGSSLVGSLYILDEPSIGLHARDTALLIKVLRELKELGNTVVVVEHDEEIIRAADYIIDIGPKAGRLGGELMYQGPVGDLIRHSEPFASRDKQKKTTEEKPIKENAAQFQSHTLNYLSGKEKIPLPELRRPWNNYIEIIAACHNNLKNINVRFPLHVMTVVSGVSGSGKSSLVRDIFYVALKKICSETSDTCGSYGELKGDIHLVHNIEFVDQNPIGKSSRSNPVTYLKAYDEIRKLFAEQALAKQMGFTASFFSFNTDGGRCEACQGEGIERVEMQFMADLVMVCEHCQGKRFKSDVLEVLYREKSIHDVLEMTVDEALEFFGQTKQALEKKIVKRLLPLQEVGLGYIKLGQSSSTLSGGESQRVKLAFFLSNERNEPGVYVFDEPTTGLHFHDIHILLKALNALIAKGHTVVIIEHNMEMIKSADYIIDLGPEGGDKGGYLLFQGKPEDLLQCRESYTARALKKHLKS
ncbi:MAG: ATP-binding cassette domain-containing protein [Bacteroidales bacterium]|nr:ATP-binding cassette domain-containing protein [Bacteroidales bacterium]